MKMINEFKEFAVKGNAIDLAVGVVVGAAFGKIVSSLVSDIINPVLGLLTGGIDFSEKMFSIGSASVMYGNFISSIIDFLIIAWVIFLVVKAMNKMKKKEAESPAEPPKPSKEEVLLTEIRDVLRSK